ncbi:YceD family protein [Corynebacterium breve]|uniref:YceD family protein n=1 Tax=Corynebacterium breve TaxID=3049799 RepID=A0ABY8VB74_9CORY|nr:YceD family protein [Corynebacterium breve]WIM66915.1 YceD family protein [Corynebacterium breve]
MATNPFVFNVVEVLHGDGMPQVVTQTGPSPSRIGPEMIAIPAGGDVTVVATLTNLGSGVLVDATATAQLKGECVRCLKELTPTHDVTISQVFSTHDEFITGDPEDDEDMGSGDEVKRVEDDCVDLEQAFIDEAGLSLPFNPTCQPSCDSESTDVPAPDGVSGEEERVDPRWAGLEKFL